MAYPDGVPSDLSLIILIVNIFVPGVGTMIAGCSGTGDGAGVIWIGVLQLLLSITIIGWIIGWIWAIVWSVGLYKKSKEEEATKMGVPTTHAQPVSHPPPTHQPQQGHNPSMYPAATQ